MTGPELPFKEVLARLDGVVRDATADVTELVWIERVRRQAIWDGRHDTGGATDAAGDRPRAGTTVLVRIEERGRTGFHQTGAGTRGELENAVRMALAQAKVNPPRPWLSPPAARDERVKAFPELLDPDLARLTPEAARELLAGLSAGDAMRRLTWTVGRVAVANSLGLRQQVVATSAVLELREPVPAGSRSAAGRARVLHAARSLRALQPEALAARLDALRVSNDAAGEETGRLPAGPLPAVLAAEATAVLVDRLARSTLTARLFRSGRSPFGDRLDRQVLDPRLDLLDDATDPAGLAFPFDLFGRAKRPVPLIEAGTLRSPAVDAEVAKKLGRPETPHAVAVDDSRPQHLFLRSGDLPREELLRRAEGGVWIGRLTRVTGTPEGGFRAVARGLRRIRGGVLGPPLPDAYWETLPIDALASVEAVGRESTVVPNNDGFTGGVCAPELALAGIRGLGG